MGGRDHAFRTRSSSLLATRSPSGPRRAQSGRPGATAGSQGAPCAVPPFTMKFMDALKSRRAAVAILPLLLAACTSGGGDTATPAGPAVVAIAVGDQPLAVAVTPDGRGVYLA